MAWRRSAFSSALFASRRGMLRDVSSGRRDTPLRCVVALSGGVDSSVAAALLVQHGLSIGVTVVGAAHMTNWSADSELEASDPALPTSCSRELQAARVVADGLGIPLHHCGFEPRFYHEVFEPMVDAFRRGHSLNPDILCNRVIKFDAFAEHARAHFEADVIATGHYARNDYWRASRHLRSLSLSQHKGSMPQATPAVLLPLAPSSSLYRPAAAMTNDQSYFLSRVPSEALARCLFPLSEFEHKSEVRSAAALVPGLGKGISSRPTSTGVCFIGKRNFHQLIESHAESLAPSQDDLRLYRPGPVRVLLDDEVESATPASRRLEGVLFRHGNQPSVARKAVSFVEHDGLAKYTLGQRLLVQGALPSRQLQRWYVAKRCLDSGTLYVVPTWDDPRLYRQSFAVHMDERVDAMAEQMLVVCRHGQPPMPCTVSPCDGDGDGSGGGKRRVRVTMVDGAKIRCPTVGQTAVFYAPHNVPNATLLRCAATGDVAES